MPFLLLILNNKRISLIIALFLCLLISLGYANHLKGQLLKADQKQTDAVANAIKPYEKAIAEAQVKANKASEDYEKLKSKDRAKTETVTREVQKIIERPVYQQHCIDADGLSAINSLIPNNSS